jgi:hypothetical protein
MANERSAQARPIDNRPVPVQPKVPVPRKDEDWKLRTKDRLTINDHVQVAHLALREDAGYMRMIDAIYDSEAVEGALSDDDVFAALAIRRWAEQQDADVSPSASAILQANTATIRHAHLIVLSRYGMSRKQRRKTVGGHAVDSDNNGGGEA